MAEYVWEKKNQSGQRVVLRSNEPVMFIDGEVWMPADGVIRPAGSLSASVRAVDGSTYYEVFVVPARKP